MKKNNKKSVKGYLKDIDNLALVRTVMAIASFIVQFVLAMHLLGVIK